MIRNTFHPTNGLIWYYFHEEFHQNHCCHNATEWYFQAKVISRNEEMAGRRILLLISDVLYFLHHLHHELLHEDIEDQKV